MKRFASVLLVLVVCFVGFYFAFATAAEQPKAATTITLTQQELQQKIDDAIRARRAAEWSVAVYPITESSGAEFIIYNGPGQATFSRWVKIGPPPSAQPAAQPAPAPAKK